MLDLDRDMSKAIGDYNDAVNAEMAARVKADKAKQRLVSRLIRIKDCEIVAQHPAIIHHIINTEGRELPIDIINELVHRG